MGLVGETLAGRYRIDALLGEGGMGSVFRAHQLVLETDVAIKVLAADRAGDEASLERFRREAKHASKLDHPNLVPVTDFGQLDDGRLYLVMPLIAGNELQARLAEPIAPEKAAEIAAQILEGLAFAHAQGLVHRDLKPENVILQPMPNGEERVRVLDFGIALSSGTGAGESRLTKANLVFGTPLYMSPEQAGGGTVDGRSDQYSVGVILHQMLAGELPFDSTDAADVLRMHLVEPPPQLPDHLPEALRAVSAKMLGKSRRERYASAEEAAAALRASVASKGAAVAVAVGAAVGGAAAAAERLPTDAEAPNTSVTPIASAAGVAPPAALASKSAGPRWPFVAAPLAALGVGAAIWFGMGEPSPDPGTALPDLVDSKGLPEPPPVGAAVDQPKDGDGAGPTAAAASSSGKGSAGRASANSGVDLPDLEGEAAKEEAADAKGGKADADSGGGAAPAPGAPPSAGDSGAQPDEPAAPGTADPEGESAKPGEDTAGEPVAQGADSAASGTSENPTPAPTPAGVDESAAKSPPDPVPAAEEGKGKGRGKGKGAKKKKKKKKKKDD
jgi:hypothetical protein